MKKSTQNKDVLNRIVWNKKRELEATRASRCKAMIFDGLYNLLACNVRELVRVYIMLVYQWHFISIPPLSPPTLLPLVFDGSTTARITSDMFATSE